ncbi:Predicted ATPase [Candidatus Terasakiella magnetica]|nr:Predicted ATPase [Candidatus Terasakiella magnetica]
MSFNIDLGQTQAGVSAHMSLEELLATRLLVQGNSGSGKSHLLRRLIEQSAPSVQQAIIDPEGDFVSLAEVFGHVVVDAAAHSENGMRLIGTRVRQHRVSVVVNLENLDTERQMRHAGAFLGGMFDTEREFWTPVLVVVDEAQMFAPAAAGDVSDEARKSSLEAMTNLMCRGRKRGLAGIIATQRLAKLAKNVAAEASNFLMGRTFLDIDMVRAAELLGIERKQAEVFRDLERGRFIGLGPALSRRPLAIKIGTVQTKSLASGAALVPLPETSPEAARELLFQTNAPDTPRPVYRPPPPPDTDEVLRELGAHAPMGQVLEMPGENAAAPPPPPPPPPPPSDSIPNVLHALFAEDGALYRGVSALYDQFLTRCRSARLNGRALDIAHFRRRLILARAGITPETQAMPEWQQVQDEAFALPEDLQGMFLLLANAALHQHPCPSDLRIALSCGSHSSRRALSILAQMEQRGLMVLYEELDGRRVVVLPSLEWKTAPGHPGEG